MDWALRWRYWLAGAAVLAVIWGVEVLRKGGLIWPWPLVPLAIWAVVLLVLGRLRAGQRASQRGGMRRPVA